MERKERERRFICPLSAVFPLIMHNRNKFKKQNVFVLKRKWMNIISKDSDPQIICEKLYYFIDSDGVHILSQLKSGRGEVRDEREFKIESYESACHKINAFINGGGVTSVIYDAYTTDGISIKILEFVDSLYKEYAIIEVEDSKYDELEMILGGTHAIEITDKPFFTIGEFSWEAASEYIRYVRFALPGDPGEE